MSESKHASDPKTSPALSLDAQRGQTLPELVAVMQRLLGPGGCPWDREQTLESLRPYAIEEAFEVVDAIDRIKLGLAGPELLKEELGDLLLQVVFQAEVTRKHGWFGPDDVVKAIHDKLVRRHPHVFGDEEAPESADAQTEKWEALKRKEKKDRGALGGVPVALPGLLRAWRVGEKASACGYDWPDATAVRAKVDEELAELDEALAEGDAEAVEQELGDVLFALSSLARKKGVDPEAALRGTLDRFTARFEKAEARARDQGQALADLTDEARDALWEAVKAEEGRRG